jgi:HPt (histidine-containing phosphotransfer) domain-containing protein
LERNNRQNSENTEKVLSSVDVHAKRMAELTHKLEKSLKAQKYLMGKHEEIEALFRTTEEEKMNISRERDSLSRWVSAYKYAIEDYEACLREMGILDLSIDIAKGGGHLKPQLKRLLHKVSGAH